MIRADVEGCVTELSLDDVSTVVFYKRDEITTDLICCELGLASDAIWRFHEEMPSWQALLDALSTLPGFDRNWQVDVVPQAFAENRFVAFRRQARG